MIILYYKIDSTVSVSEETNGMITLSSKIAEFCGMKIK